MGAEEGLKRFIRTGDQLEMDPRGFFNKRLELTGELEELEANDGLAFLDRESKEAIYELIDKDNSEHRLPAERENMRFAERNKGDASVKFMPGVSLCGCLVHVSADRLEQFMQYPGVNLVEWRLDSFIKMSSFEDTLDMLPLLSTFARHPVVVTNRPLHEGGAYDGSEEQRIQILQKGLEAGAEWVDIEASAGSTPLERFRCGHARIVLSHHDFSGTADGPSLRRLAEKMAEKKPDVIKIICYAKTPQDNLRVLELIPFGQKELGIDIIAFCMGPFGGWSRLACLSLGSPWTYVQFPGLAPSAPGQYTAEEMRLLLHQGRWT